MSFLGVDLAWSDTPGAQQKTGVLAVDEAGRVIEAGWIVGVDATAAWANRLATEEATMFVDAPLLVLNETGQRPCEKRVGQRYGRWKVLANSTNGGSPRKAGVRLRQQLEDSGWGYADGVTTTDRPHTLSECYPYTTLVGADELGYDVERPLYKPKPKRMKVAAWRPQGAERCDELIDRIRSLGDAEPPLNLLSHETTARLLGEPSPLEDPRRQASRGAVDACLAAWTALLEASPASFAARFSEPTTHL